ncbi:MAG: hypothetical protein Q4F07_07230 [Bacteroidales bacterium]|nr:hypothetical protein [Bacteroidales bacterium]
MEFDEQKAIEFIRQHAPEIEAAAYDDDEILNVIDMIYDYYEANGMLDVDFDEDGDDDETEFGKIVDYVGRMLAKDKAATIQPCHIAPIVEAEQKYEESLVNGD